MNPEVVLSFELQALIRKFSRGFVVEAEGALNGVNFSAGMKPDFRK